MVSVHLDFLRPALRYQQILQMVEVLKERRRPRILLGDLNCSLHHERAGLEPLRGPARPARPGHARTRPADLPGAAAEPAHRLDPGLEPARVRRLPHPAHPALRPPRAWSPTCACAEPRGPAMIELPAPRPISRSKRSARRASLRPRGPARKPSWRPATAWCCRPPAARSVRLGVRQHGALPAFERRAPASASSSSTRRQTSLRHRFLRRALPGHQQRDPLAHPGALLGLRGAARPRLPLRLRRGGRRRRGRAAARAHQGAGGADPPLGRQHARLLARTRRIRPGWSTGSSELGVGVLFAIGGDGTLRGVSALAERNPPAPGAEIAVVGVPKTIDNDIALIERSFGFATAVEAARTAIDGAHAEAAGALNGDRPGQADGPPLRLHRRPRQPRHQRRQFLPGARAALPAWSPSSRRSSSGCASAATRWWWWPKAPARISSRPVRTASSATPRATASCRTSAPFLKEAIGRHFKGRDFGGLDSNTSIRRTSCAACRPTPSTPNIA